MTEAEEALDDAANEGRDEGANFVLSELAHALKLERWEQKDASETWDGDVHATLMGILYGASVLDPETNERVAYPEKGDPIAWRVRQFEDQRWNYVADKEAVRPGNWKFADPLYLHPPCGQATDIEAWIEKSFAGLGRAIRAANNEPILDEPYMSMGDAKALVRRAVSDLHPPRGQGAGRDALAAAARNDALEAAALTCRDVGALEAERLIRSMLRTIAPPASAYDRALSTNEAGK